MASLVHRDSQGDIARCLSSIPESPHYLIALSGGLDSSCLLRLAAPFLRQRGARVSAIHVHHGVSPNADDWATFCVSLCCHYDLDCHVERVRVELAGEGWEAAARRARYQAFEQHMTAHSILLQGHHQNDQIETVVMRVLKRSDLMTLSGIPVSRPLSRGLVFRPWLSLPRATLHDLARAKGWAWIEDESNQDARFDRNAVRLQLLPRLNKQHADLSEQVLTLSRQVQALEQVMSRLCAWGRDYCDAQGRVLDLGKLNTLSCQAQMLLIRDWVDRHGLQQVPEAIFKRLWSEVLPASSDTSPELCWSGVTLRRFAQQLFLFRPEDLQSGLAHDGSAIVRELAIKELYDEPSVSLAFGPYRLELQLLGEEEQGSFEAFQGGESAQSERSGDYLVLPPGSASLLVRGRRAADKIRLSTRSGSTALKKLWKPMQVPPWCRDQWPLIEFDGGLIWAGPGQVAAEYVPFDPAVQCLASERPYVLRVRLKSLNACYPC